jgi:TolA-binding protein
MQTIEEEADEVDCSVQVDILNTAQVESLKEQLETLNKQHKVLIEQLQDELEEANRRIEEFESQK